MGLAMFRYVIAVLVLVFTSVSHASVILGTTRVIVKSSDKEATVQIRNPDSIPKLIQAWIDSGNKNASPDVIDVPFQILPPVFRINAGKGQALRILALPNDLPNDRESVFWLNVLEVPPKPSDLEGENYVQFALRNRIKLFYRPAKLEGRASSAGEKLEWRLREGKLIVNNPTPYHVSLSSAAVILSTSDDPVDVLVDMVKPFSEYSINVEGASISVGKTINFSYIDDLGAIRKLEGIVSR